MRTAIIRVLCTVTRAFPPLYLDKVAKVLIPAGTLPPDDAIHWLGRYQLVIRWGTSGSWDLYGHGLFEPHVRDQLKRRTPRGGQVIDVGANIGLHTIPLSDWVGDDGCVLAVEPDDVIRGWLEEALARNPFTRNVIVSPVALSDHLGEAKFYSPKSETVTGKGSLEKLDDTELVAVRVPLSTIDELVRQQGWDRVDVIKIDVEGHDLSVLRGASKTLAEHHPVLSVEYEPRLWRKAGCTYEHLFDYLSQFGYQIWRLPIYRWRGLRRPAPLRLSRNLPAGWRETRLDILAMVEGL